MLVCERKDMTNLIIAFHNFVNDKDGMIGP